MLSIISASKTDSYFYRLSTESDKEDIYLTFYSMHSKTEGIAIPRDGKSEKKIALTKNLSVKN